MMKDIPGLRIKSKIVKTFDGLDLWTQTYQNAPDWRIKNTLVFSHGLANAGQVWEAIIEYILENKPRTKCIIYDLRGHGRSTKKFSHLSGTRIELIHAYDLKTVIKKLAPWRPILVGHSMGGIIIQEYLNLEPKLWSKPRQIFLLATNTQTRKIAGLNRDLVMEKFSKLNQYEQKPAIAKDFEEYMSHAGKNDFNWKKILCTATNIPVESSLLHWLGVINWENAHPEKIDRANVMLIYGTQDLIFPVAQVKKTVARSKKMQSKEINSQHGLNVLAAEEVALEICKKLR